MTTPERRTAHPELRPLFEEAYTLIRPFFDDANSWSAGHGHTALAFHALREHFPQLAPEQLHIIVIAAQRVFNSGRAITAS